jgi:protein disulfide-isomerase A6
MMWNTQSIALCLALASSLASAAIFPKDTTVKMLDPKGFRKAMKANETSMVAFVAPWCGHCQRMAPEYSKAALGLYPLIPTYAVDCDADANKRLCAEQGVQGFPTVKLFPRGQHVPPMTYDSGERTASAFFYWASRRVPNHIKKFKSVDEVPAWVEETAKKPVPRALLLTKEKKTPLLWTVLGNNFAGEIELAVLRDRKGKASVAMGYDANLESKSNILIYPVGSTKAARYEGITKLDSLSKFFKSVIDGTADLKVIIEEAAAEEFVADETELEIQRKQEAQRMALAHGGFAEFIDFEDALKKGNGADYHATHGYPGMMGDVPKKKVAEEAEAGNEVKTEAAEPTVEDDQVVFAASPAEEPEPSAPAEPASSEAAEEKIESVPEPEPASAPKDEL